MKKILVLHGPNLNLLGKREPHLYGHTTLKDINEGLHAKAKLAQVNLICFQTNDEAEMINSIHQALNDKIDYLIINAAAYAHTSIALRDALAAVKIPFVEVHLTNIFAREHFRHHSYLSSLANGVISGFGAKSYDLALNAVLEHCS